MVRKRYSTNASGGAHFLTILEDIHDRDMNCDRGLTYKAD